MTQEEKDLLLKDLCGRLQYKPHCRVFKLNEDIKENDDVLYGIIGDNVMTLKSNKDECLMYYQIKPYLRPMLSMTEEEKEELKDICTMYNGDPGSTYEYFGIEVFNISRYGTNFESDYTVIDWLNAHHFDYRGLIDKGLALEAPEDMYKK